MSLRHLASKKVAATRLAENAAASVAAALQSAHLHHVGFIDGGHPLRIRVPAIIGTGAALCLTSGLLLWSWLAPIASALITTGIVVANTDRRIVAHPEGGVVQAIAVQDGDSVQAGQELVTLDSSRLVRGVATLVSQIATSLAQEARLTAEGDLAASMLVPNDQDGVRVLNFPAAWGEQTGLFAARRATLEAQISSLQNDAAQSADLAAAMLLQVSALEKRILLAGDDLKAAAFLAQTGDDTRLRVRQLGGGVAELLQQRASLQARAAEARSRAEQAVHEIKHVRSVYVVAALSELQNLQKDRIELFQKLKSKREQIRNRTVRSPIAGSVVGLSTHTLGGVVNPGVPMLELVPSTDDLVISLQVRPADIGFVQLGSAADVRVSAVDFERREILHGRIASISADRLNDRNTGAPYFDVRIRTDRETTDRGALRVGMDVDVFVYRGEHTALDYLVEPLTWFLWQRPIK